MTKTARKPVVAAPEQPEIIFPRYGPPLKLAGAPHARSLSASFLADYQNDYETHGKGIFRLMYETQPGKYFDGLLALARVMRVEIGPPQAFDAPATEAEALQRLEERAGPQAREMLERFLREISTVETKLLEQKDD